MKVSKMGQKLTSFALGIAMVAASILGASCKPDRSEEEKFAAKINEKFTEGRTFAGGVEVDAKTLQDGHDAYMLYCYACHGINGDGHGPSSYGLRPPPRDFTKGIFKFARLRSSDELPNDDDLVRIVHGGLHGTAMLAWDIPEIELEKIIQYIKTFAPEKWEKKKKNGEPVKTLDAFEAPADPYENDDEGGWKYGRDLYHFRAECVNCHPAYGTKKELYELSVAAAKREPDKFKALGGFRDDPYQPVAKDSPEYNQRIMPPDFTFNNVRSAREGTELEDLFRLISFGVYPIMPAWKGAGLSDKDIWALSHYVKHLIDLKGTKELADLHTSYTTQAAFAPPKAEEEKKPEPPPADSAAAEGDKKDDAKPEEKPASDEVAAPGAAGDAWRSRHWSKLACRQEGRRRSPRAPGGQTRTDAPSQPPAPAPKKKKADDIWPERVGPLGPTRERRVCLGIQRIARKRSSSGRPARQAEELRGACLVVVGALERFLDEGELERVDAAAHVEPELARPRRRAGDVRRQVLDADDAVAQHESAADLVLELTDVAGPPVGREAIHRRRRDAGLGAAVLAEEKLHEERHVVGAVGERRNPKREDRQAVVEVLAERSRLHHRLEVAVGRGDDADVDLAAALRTHGPDVAVLEDAEQLRLHPEAHFADLVEEERAAVSDLEQAGARAVGAGERAADVAEERRLEQALRDRAAVLADERLGGARGPL